MEEKSPNNAQSPKERLSTEQLERLDEVKRRHAERKKQHEAEREISEPLEDSMGCEP
jgi:hypothetical protein